jgi:hypothetical protein
VDLDRCSTDLYDLQDGVGIRRAVSKPTHPSAAIGKNNRSPRIGKDEERRLPFFCLRPHPKNWELAVQYERKAVISKVEHKMMMSILHNSSHK